MVRKVILGFAALGVFGAIAGGVLCPNAFGAEWYPFYGYRRPSYLGQPYVVSVQPAVVQPAVVSPVQPSTQLTVQPVGQATTVYYPSAEDVVVPVQTASPCQYSAPAQWYPFYGNYRPSYLDR
jgi:hypothetical protein